MRFEAFPHLLNIVIHNLPYDARIVRYVFVVISIDVVKMSIIKSVNFNRVAKILLIYFISIRYPSDTNRAYYLLILYIIALLVR